jgi:hypothetical protein
MAFFGLTSLGSQSPFELVKETPLHVFEPSDFQDAFMRTFRPGFSLYSESDEEAEAARELLGTASISHAQLADVLRVLFKCPVGVDNVPKMVRELVERECGGIDGCISLPVFLDAMDRACKASEALEARESQRVYIKDGIATREFVSNGELRAKLAKHTRMTRDPQQKMLGPMTDTQTLGWREPTIVMERRPTKSCEETLYASAMVKAGVYYY